MSNSEERPRGMLTPTDRAFLRGETKYDRKQQTSNRYQSIRERVANGLLDFNIIQHSLRAKDRKRIFQDPANAARVSDPLFFEALRSMFYWTYLGLKEQNYDFEGLLVDAIKQAEEDFARKYWGENVSVDIHFDIEVKRSHSIDDLIAAVENGGPVKAKSLYELLELSGGVPIDTSKIDTLRVWFHSSYPEGEKAVVETLFSEYLNIEVEIEDATSRADVSGLESERESAVIDIDRSRPSPSEIKNYSTSTGDNFEDTIENIRLRESTKSSTEKRSEANNTDSILESVIGDMVDGIEDPPPSIYDFIDNNEKENLQDSPVTPEAVFELLEGVHDPFASTFEIAAALNCAPDAARQALSKLSDEGSVERQSVIDSSRKNLSIWSIKPEDQNIG